MGELRARFGEEAALRLATLSERIPGRGEPLGEDVWLRRDGMLMVSTARAQDAHVDRAVAVARAAGRPEGAVPFSATEVAARCRSPLFRRGVLFPDCSTVHPGRLVRALRRAVLAAGVAVFEGTRAAAVEPGRCAPRAARSGRRRSSSRRTPR